MKNRLFPNQWLAIIALVLLGAFLRLFQLSRQSYWMDEGFTINAVLAVLDHGNTVLDSGYTYFCPIYCYPAAWLAALFGQAAFAYRLLASLTGILFIPIFWAIAQKTLNNRVAFLATLFVSLSYWQVAWSRQARWYTLLEVAIWFVLFFAFRYYQSGYKTNHYLILLTGCLLLAILIQPTASLLAFYLMISFALTARRHHPRDTAALIIIFAVLMYLTDLAIARLSNQPVGFLMETIRLLRPDYNLPYYLHFYLVHYWLFVLLSIYALLQEKSQSFLKFAVGLFVLYLIAFSLLTDIIHYRYLFPLTPALYLGGAIGLEKLIRQVSRPTQRFALLFGVIALYILTGQGIVWPQNFYQLESDNPKISNRPHYAYTPQPNFNAAYQRISQSLKEGDIVISSHPVFTKIFLDQPGYWLSHDYLGSNRQQGCAQKELYVNATTINNVAELKEIIQQNHGYIVFDYASSNNRIDPALLYYIRSETKAFYSTGNDFSSIWVYTF